MYFHQTASYAPTAPLSYAVGSGSASSPSYSPVSSSYASSSSGSSAVLADDMCRGACGTKYGCARCRTSD